MLAWFNPLQKAIQSELTRILENYTKIKDPSTHDSDVITLWSCVSPEKLSIITAHEVLAIKYSKEQSLITEVALKIGDAIRAEANYNRMTSEQKETFHRIQGMLGQFKNLFVVG